MLKSTSKYLIYEFGWIPLFFLVIYLIFPTKMHYTDGLDFAYFLERKEFGLEGFHPHHPVFLPLTRLIYGFIVKVFPAIRAIEFLAIISSLSGSLGIWLLMRLLRVWGERPSSSALAGAFLGSSFTYWRYSTDADAYIFSFALGLWSLVIISSFNDQSTPTKAIFAGFLIALSILTHQLAIFIAIPILYLILFKPDKTRQIKKLSAILIITVAIFLLTHSFINFLIFYSSTGGSIEKYWSYISSHAQDRYFWTILNQSIITTVCESARSHTHLFFPLRPPELIFYDNIRGDTRQSLIFYRLFTSLSALFVLVTLFFIQKFEPQRKHIFRMLYIWLAIVFTFTTVFMPENHFYKIFYLPPFIIIVGEFVRRISQLIRFKPKIILFFMLVAYFTFNLTKGIIPDSKKESNPFYYHTERINQIVHKGDLVIFPSEKRYLTKFYRYFGNGEALRVTNRIAYLDYWGEIWPKRLEFSDKTANYFKSHFRNIYISEAAWAQGEEFLMFSTYQAPGDKPFVLMIEKERLVAEKTIMGFDGRYLKIVVR